MTMNDKLSKLSSVYLNRVPSNITEISKFSNGLL